MKVFLVMWAEVDASDVVEVWATADEARTGAVAAMGEYCRESKTIYNDIRMEPGREPDTWVVTVSRTYKGGLYGDEKRVVRRQYEVRPMEVKTNVIQRLGDLA